MKLKMAYDNHMPASNETGLACKDATLAQQSFLEETDINTLVERFGITGEMPQVEQLPSQGDFTGIFDFQTAMNAIAAAKETFGALPAKLRARFHNDPAEFLDFCDDEDNRPEAVKMGLLKEPQQPQAPQVPENKGETPKTPNVTQ